MVTIMEMILMVQVQHKINVSRMRLRMQFGHYENTDKTNPNTGMPIKEFKADPKLTRWAGQWSITQYDTLKLSGSDIKDSLAFFIRHDDSITSDYIMKWGTRLFTIDHIERDIDPTRTQYDVIYCHVYGDRKHG